MKRASLFALVLVIGVFTGCRSGSPIPKPAPTSEQTSLAGVVVELHPPIIEPEDVAVDPSGALLVLNWSLCEIVRVEGDQSTVQPCGIPISGSPPTGMAVDASGTVFLNSSCGVFAVTKTGPTRLPGTEACFNSGNEFLGIAVDKQGDVYYVASGGDCSIKKYDGNRTMTAIENVCARGISVDEHGVLYATLGDCTVARIEDGQVTRIAGNGTCSIDQQDDGPALDLSLQDPQGIALASNGDVYLAESFRIRRLSSGRLTTVAGSVDPGYSGDGGRASKAAVGAGFGIAIDRHDQVFFVEFLNCVVRRISGGQISTVVGTPCPTP